MDLDFKSFIVGSHIHTKNLTAFPGLKLSNCKHTDNISEICPFVQMNLTERVG